MSDIPSKWELECDARDMVPTGTMLGERFLCAFAKGEQRDETHCRLKSWCIN